jgi:hypothetical protein
MPEVPGSGGVLREARAEIGGFKKFILRGNMAAPSGADIADHAAKVLAARLQGRDGT